MVKYYEYILQNCIQVSPTIYRIFVRPKRPQMKLDYVAGQYINILYPNGSYQSISIANAPQPMGNIELHVRCLANDQNTQAFIEQLQEQKTLTFQGPFGQCVYHDNSRPTLLLAAGTGFAQAKAIIEQAKIMHHYPLMHLYWGVKTQQDFYLPELITHWIESIPHFAYTPAISQSEPISSWTGKLGYVPPLAIADYPHLQDFQVYVSGPKAMATSALELSQIHGLSKEFFYSDMI